MEKLIQLRTKEEAFALYGAKDHFLKMIRNHHDVKIFARNGHLRIAGSEPNVLEAYATLLNLLELYRNTGSLRTIDVENALLGRTEEEESSKEKEAQSLDPFQPKTEGQRRYIEAIRSNDITFGVGPAGTGKTFLAVACAVSALVRSHVQRLVLVRPAIEAGEKLGFLPGDLQAKVNPYLRPIFDSLRTVMPAHQVQTFIDRDLIEIAPLAYMRGRTLDRCFVILDEAQNCTSKQMLMFLTRLGAKSKAVITGDITQTDLPETEVSGLEDALQKLDSMENIAICQLGKNDIIRHELVRRIIHAYGEDEEA